MKRIAMRLYGCAYKKQRRPVKRLCFNFITIKSWQVIDRLYCCSGSLSKLIFAAEDLRNYYFYEIHMFK